MKEGPEMRHRMPISTPWPSFAPMNIDHLCRKFHYELLCLQRRPDLPASSIPHTKLSIRIPVNPT